VEERKITSRAELYGSSARREIIPSQADPHAWESPERRIMGREIAEGITVDPRVMVGKPVIKGTRMPVELVLAKLAANPSLDDLFLDYPELSVDQVCACLHFATKLIQGKREPLTRRLQACKHSCLPTRTTLGDT
jgi:uncharacterized protein (DUF433 family)